MAGAFELVLEQKALEEGRIMKGEGAIFQDNAKRNSYDRRLSQMTEVKEYSKSKSRRPKG